MAHDYDDNVLLDSDDEGAKAKKTKDFIPKPRILTAPASKLAAIAGQSSNQTEDVNQQQTVDSKPGEQDGDASSNRKNFIEPPAADAENRAASSADSNSNGVHRISVQFKDNEHTERTAPVESTNVHLVEHQTDRPADIKIEEGTYKRLISESPSVEEQPADVTIVQENNLCLCRICSHPTIKKNWKIYLGAIILTILGIGLIILGLMIGTANGFTKDLKSIIFLVGGILLLVPGGYHFLFLSLAAYNVRGFKFTKLPTIK